MSAARLLDENHFRIMTGDDPDLQKEILGLFQTQAEIWQRLLIPDAPVETWRDAAHTLKGSARGVGFWALADACETAETLAKCGDRDGPRIAAGLAKVRDALRAALDEIAAMG